MSSDGLASVFLGNLLIRNRSERCGSLTSSQAQFNSIVACSGRPIDSIECKHLIEPVRRCVSTAESAGFPGKYAALTAYLEKRRSTIGISTDFLKNRARSYQKKAIPVQIGVLNESRREVFIWYGSKELGEKLHTLLVTETSP